VVHSGFGEGLRFQKGGDIAFEDINALGLAGAWIILSPPPSAVGKRGDADDYHGKRIIRSDTGSAGKISNRGSTSESGRLHLKR